jgi:hypothetical protein
MTAVSLAFRAELRKRWRSWLAMALLIAVIGGVVLGLVAAGRRTASAFPRLLAVTNSADALVYSASGFSVPPVSVTHLSQVAESGDVAFPQAQLSLDGRTLSSVWQLEAAASSSFGKTIERQRLLRCRWANPLASDQALVSFSPPDGMHIGSVVRLRFYKPDQAGELFDSFGPIPVPAGASASVHVVGVEASSADFPAGSSPQPTLYITPALFREIGRSSAVAYASAVRLHGGAADSASFEAAVAHLHGGAELYVDSVEGSYLNVERSIHLQVVSWWILAAIAGAAGLVVIAQLLARQTALQASEFKMLRAIGMGSRDLFALGLLSTVSAAVVGGLGAMAMAYAVSPLTPIGEAAVAEPDPGLSFDSAALLIGALALFILVTAVGAIPAALEARRRRPPGDTDGWAEPQRPSIVASWLAQAGGAISTVVGARLAFERGRGQGSVPSFAAFCGATLGVLALVGTSVFGASLGHLLDSPRLYGGTFDLQINNPGGAISTIVPGLPSLTGTSRS